MRIFNAGDKVKSCWDNKIYTVYQVWGEILRCKGEDNNLIELMDFEVIREVK
jgi:hypothetical protein